MYKYAEEGHGKQYFILKLCCVLGTKAIVAHVVQRSFVLVTTKDCSIAGVKLLDGMCFR